MTGLWRLAAGGVAAATVTAISLSGAQGAPGRTAPAPIGSFTFTVLAQPNAEPGGAVTALARAGDGLLLAHAPTHAIEHVDGDGKLVREASTNYPVGSFSGDGRYAAIAAGVAGQGDVLERKDGAWSPVIDSLTATSAVVAGSGRGSFAASGEPMLDGQVHAIRRRVWVEGSDTLPNAFPTAAAGAQGDDDDDRASWIAATDHQSGAARLFRGRSGRFDEVPVALPGPALQAGERQEVRALHASRRGDLVAGVGVFDAMTGAAKSGLVVRIGDRGSAVELGSGFPAMDAPAALERVEGQILVGTVGGRLLRLDDKGAWVELAGLPANQGVLALLWDGEGRKLLAGLKTAGGAVLAQGVPAAAPPPPPPPPPLAAPSGLTAVAPIASQVDLTWKDNSADETGFSIERAPGGTTNFAAIAMVASNVQAYSDKTVVGQTAYAYRVIAKRDQVSSAASNMANVTTPAVPAAPAAPSGLVASAPLPTQVDLSWSDNSNNEVEFVIERAPGGTTNFAAVGMVAADVKAWSDKTVVAQTAYSYRVFARNAIGSSQPSNVVNITTPAVATAPVAPSGLTAVAASSTKVDLAWTDNSDNETDFLVERAPGGTTNFAALATVAANVKAYSDTTVVAATVYSYRVTARNGALASAPSNVANVTTPAAAPAAPSGLTAVASSATKVDLAWTDNSNNETGFLVERAPGGTTNFAMVGTVAANVRAYSDTTVVAQTAYSYRVTARNGALASAPSNVANVTTPAPPPTYLKDIKPILAGTAAGMNFALSCAGCHTNGRPYALSTGLVNDAADYNATIGQIDRTTPANSALLRRATQQAGHPLAMFNVGSAPYNTILQWIQAGAPMN